MIYILSLKLEKDIVLKTRARIFRLNAGSYLYIGSATKNLEARLLRHYYNKKKYFWHIDYLLKFAKINNILLSPHSKNECQLVKELFDKFKAEIIPYFGASDCKCQSHLLRVLEK